MPRLIYALMACLWTSFAFPAELDSAKKRTPASKQSSIPDSRQLETSLQALNWEQFRSVVEAEPKLKAGVEAYGPAGWQFVKANYKSYKWRRPIDKLDANQKRRLSELIKSARLSTPAQPRKTTR